MSYGRSIVWFRKDLRVVDNPALSQACQSSNQVCAVFLIPIEQWQQHGMAPIQMDLIRRQLEALKVELAELNIPLWLVNAGDYQGQVDLLGKLSAALQVDALFVNRELEINEQKRDQKVRALLKIKQHWFDDTCVIPPGCVVSGQGTPYQVFTPFAKAWKLQLFKDGVNCLAKPGVKAVWQAPSVPEEPIEPWPANGISSYAFGVGTEYTLAQLRAFVQAKVSHYHCARDFPAQQGTSSLSPYLAIGALSSRQCLARLLYQQSPDEISGGAETWLNELIWREFYKHVMVAWPKVQKGRCFKAEYEQLLWPNDQQWFDAWCQGRTGYPIVDAAMRQLNETGWMHNRLRMIVASFLTKDLLIDWRWGERYFMTKLIDGDLSANNGGWQWAASTGTDAAPYFRIFNPSAQSKRFDPKGHFIRLYLKELATLDDKLLHKPGDGQNYTQAIVDHSVQRQKALNLYESTRSQAR